MKKILLINGSPKRRRSNTRRLAYAFFDGMKSVGEFEIEEFICAEKEIAPCMGCFHCWKNPDGNCVLSDDHAELFQKYLSADIVAWSFPNYYYGMPSIAKAALDRMLPLCHQTMEEPTQKTTKHTERYQLDHQKYLLFVTCGFPNKERNTDPISDQFSLMYGDRCEQVICSEGELFAHDFMRAFSSSYLNVVRQAGAAYAVDGEISPVLREKLAEPILEKERYLAFVNTSALVRGRDESAEHFNYRKAKALMKMMALTYTPKQMTVDQAVIEIEIQDCAYVCQLCPGRTDCSVRDDPAEFVPFHLKVVANYSFFVPQQTLETVTAGDAYNVDFQRLLDLAEKCVKRGRSKTMRFLSQGK